MRPEASLQLEVCKYLRQTWPGVIFHSDLSAGAALSIGQAVANKKMQFSAALPDIYILKPRFEDDGTVYHGLLIELKKEGTKIYRLDGELVADPHIRDQVVMLEMLRAEGYAASFGIGYEDCVNQISEYLA